MTGDVWAKGIVLQHPSWETRCVPLPLLGRVNDRLSHRVLHHHGSCSDSRGIVPGVLLSGCGPVNPGDGQPLTARQPSARQLPVTVTDSHPGPDQGPRTSLFSGVDHLLRPSAGPTLVLC